MMQGSVIYFYKHSFNQSINKSALLQLYFSFSGSPAIHEVIGHLFPSFKQVSQVRLLVSVCVWGGGGSDGLLRS